MNSLQETLDQLTEYKGIKEALKRKHTPTALVGCQDTQKCHFLAGLLKDYTNSAIIVPNEARAREVCDDLRFFGINARLYPAKDLIFFHADIKGKAIVKERESCIKSLLSDGQTTLVMTIDACLDRILPVDRIRSSVVKITLDDEIDLNKLSEKLVTLGYERVAQVSAPGEFCVKGGLVDIFPLNDDNPTRIEFFGDTPDTIRTFDVLSQRSLENTESLEIFPASEYILTDDEMQEGFIKIRSELENDVKLFRKDMKGEEAERLSRAVTEALDQIEYSRGTSAVDSFSASFYDRTVSILDYFSNDDLVVLDEPSRVNETGKVVFDEYRESVISRIEHGYILASQADVVFDIKQIIAKAAGKRLLTLSALTFPSIGFDIKETFATEVRSLMPYSDDLNMLIEDVKFYGKRDYVIYIITGSTAKAQRLAEELQNYDIKAYFMDATADRPGASQVAVLHGALHKGFVYPGLKLAVLVEGDTFSQSRKKKKKFADNGKGVHSLHELVFGDYVVHERNGLGIYRGIEKLEHDKTAQDYVKIEYADGLLYIPATNLESIQKYASADADKKPKVNKINSPEWRKTRDRVKSAVQDIAEELIRLYAIRNTKPGFVFRPDTTWQTEFEEMFPYEETDDQLKAIADTKRDMESNRIMDRLICGDVGYGKTEIALRAAFKAVQNNKQVAVLVPTTILAQQHYNTFTNRLAQYGVRVDMLSRFRTPAQQKETLAGLSSGLVDIVIGTHRLLSKDVKYKDLGLLVVDEEQRFGVTHKERIKEIKNNVDVLTLTATPIPRTLHMSLSGIRDMSVLEEPPVDRLPIQTFVMEHNDEVIREAVNRELARGGQVYYVYNRVNGIEEKANLIKTLCPDANVVFAHGQMSERELEKIMYSFINNEIDVLVSTTIIETGMDISNVNTMIIDDADKLGLSQLYQLRGRVGRSSRTAYAFLMYKRGQVLKEIAEKRLTTIKEFTDLGSGFRIAMRDLEIRGAGNVLGAEQSGHMEEVGYDLYCKLLDNAVKKAKGEEILPDDYDTTFKIPVDAYIPDKYISNEVQKLDMYKRIAMVETEEEVSDVLDELTDRYGDIPLQVKRLIDVAQLKSLAHSVYITQISEEKVKDKNGKLRDGVYKLLLYPKAPFDIQKFGDFLAKHDTDIIFTDGETPFLLCFLEKIGRGDQLPSASRIPQTLQKQKKDTIKDIEQRNFIALKDLFVEMKGVL